MKRRNFLKLLGLAIPAASLPVAVKAQEVQIEPEVQEPKGNQQYSYTESALSKDDVKLDFDFGDDVPVTIVSHEGSFRHSPRVDWYPNPHSNYREPAIEAYDFEINMYIAWVSDVDFRDKIHNSKKFDLTVIYNGRTFILKDVYWSNMYYEPGSIAFSLSGVAIDVGT